MVVSFVRRFWNSQAHLSKKSKLQICLFVSFAFSLYYAQYFRDFSQGVVTGRSVVVDILKLCTFVCLGSIYYSGKVAFRPYDWCFLGFIGVAASSYFVGGVVFGFNDKLFINFFLFSICYVFMLSRQAEEGILFSYQILCLIIFFQVCVSVVLNIADIDLWDRGLFVGGLGNPTSFGFVCLFCLLYLLFVDRVFTFYMQSMFMAAYIYAVFMTNALFPAIFISSFFPIALFLLKTKKQRVSFALAFFLGLLFFLLTPDVRNTLLLNKTRALLDFLGLPGWSGQPSISISIRAENNISALTFLRSFTPEWMFGHWRGTNYFPVDSQYFAYLFSFGVPLLLYFLIFNFLALVKAWKIQAPERIFILTTAVMFASFFFNNRVLDYFPIAYLYISLVAMISRLAFQEKSSHLNKVEKQCALG